MSLVVMLMVALHLAGWILSLSACDLVPNQPAPVIPISVKGDLPVPNPLRGHASAPRGEPDPTRDTQCLPPPFRPEGAAVFLQLTGFHDFQQRGQNRIDRDRGQDHAHNSADDSGSGMADQIE